MVDGRTTDGRRFDGYTISSPFEPNGSGELTKPLNQCFHLSIHLYFFIRGFKKKHII